MPIQTSVMRFLSLAVLGFATVVTTVAGSSMAAAQEYGPHWRYTVVDSAFDGLKAMIIHRRGTSFDDPDGTTIIEGACVEPYTTATMSFLLDTSGIEPGSPAQLYLYGDGSFNFQQWGEVMPPSTDQYPRLLVEIPLDSGFFDQMQTGRVLQFSIPGREGNSAHIATPEARQVAAEFMAKCNELRAEAERVVLTESEDMSAMALAMLDNPALHVISPLTGTWTQTQTTGGPGCNDCKFVSYGTEEAIVAVTTDCVVFRGTYLNTEKTMAAGVATMTQGHPLSELAYFSAMVRTDGQSVDLSLSPDPARSQGAVLHSPITISYGKKTSEIDATAMFRTEMVANSCPFPDFFAMANSRAAVQ